MRVNMFSERLRKDVHARAKNGQPAHSTTGVLRTNSSQTAMRYGNKACQLIPGTCADISQRTRGAVSAVPTQKRRVMSRSSGLPEGCAVGCNGSSAMPQIGQLPGAARRISGCIGQV